MSHSIRKATLQDHSLIVESQVAMALESEGLALPLNTVSQGVEAVLKDPTKGDYWIAEVGGKTVGCLLCIPEWSDWRNSTVLWIHSVYTWPEHRKTGVYKALYSHLKQKIENSSEYAGIRLYVEKENYGAQEVYSKLGMSSDHYFLYEWLK